MARLRRPALLCAVVAVSAALALGACGASSGTRTVGTAHAVVGFAAHAGLAFGAFKLFIEDPYREGKLSFRHPITLAKAGVAALFAYHEVKTALAELRGHPALSRLIGPFTVLATALRLLRSHPGSSSAVSGVERRIGAASGQASAAGSPIHAITRGLSI